jgi:hypothetical protein
LQTAGLHLAGVLAKGQLLKGLPESLPPKSEENLH